MSETGAATKTEGPKSARTLDSLKRDFDDARFVTQEARRQSDIDRDYYDGHQLTDGEKRVLRKRRQPEIIINRVRRGIDGILGVLEQGKADPRAYMRNPPDPQTGGTQPYQTAAGVPRPGQQVMGGNGGPPLDAPDAADVATMTLRFIADTNHFGPLKMDVAENFMVEGTGACIVEAVGDDVTVTQIRWEEFFYDPRSRRPDFADARYMGVAKWMYADALAGIYPEFAQQITDTASAEGAGGIGIFDQSWQDRPNNIYPWVDTKQKRLMVVEMYYLEAGQWWRCVFIVNQILEQDVSAYQDDKGRTICPIEAQSAYVDRENRRYGPVRDMRGPQDGLNMSHSKRLHAANLRQVQPIDINSAPVNVDEVRKEAARPDGVIPPGWKIADNNPAVASAVEGMQEFKAELERLGPNPAILGRQGADASGRAVLARQQAGMTELARVLGRLNDWELRVYKQMWARARQFWSAPKWIRVTDEDGAPQYVRVNEPTGQMEMQRDPATGQAVPTPKVNNHIAKMDVDIIIDTVPDTATLQQEIFQDILQLARVNPQAYPPEVILEFAPIANKCKVKDAIEAAQAKAAQNNQGPQQMAMAKAQAELEELKSIINKNNALAGLNEVQTVVTALEGHLKATSAAQLPPGFTLDGNGQHVPLPAPPPPGAFPGASGPSAVN
jgi:hypothetical protein